MSDDVLALCFGVHNHQPVGNFDHVVAEATERAYAPLLDRLIARPEVRLTAHFTGNLLEWLRERAPATFDRLATVVARGQVELLTGGFYEPILSILPDGDKRGQIARLSEFIRAHFGVRPRGMWLAERVWEPHLPGPLSAVGVEYVLVDDRHFALGGLDPEAIGGYYLTEDQGQRLRVFPISQRLRYLIPFADVEASLDYLASRRGAVPVLTVVDDGEKFGVWPGTYTHVYEHGWLDRFFDRLLATSWLSLTTFSDVVDRLPAIDRVYLPTASYREMGEWALLAPAGRELLTARRELSALADGERLQGLLRGGFWRAFLMKYPEVADTYWKMMRLSHALTAAEGDRPGDGRLAAARLALWRGQANDAYWHGVFGGCYLPHLRRAIKQALLEAERGVDAVVQPALPAWTRGDLNGDGREEIEVRTSDLTVMICPEAGGSLTEIAATSRRLDLADVLARRPEAYHDEVRQRLTKSDDAGAHTIHDAPGHKESGLEKFLQYDDLRRASLLDGLWDDGEVLDPVAPWSDARFVLGRIPMAATVMAARVDRISGAVTVDLVPAAESSPLRVQKRLVIEGGSVEARYRLTSRGGVVGGRWGVQWNLAVTAGEGRERYLDVPGRPAPRSVGRETQLTRLALIDEWIGIEAELTWSPGAEISWGPVETISVSEAGFERIYQGTAFLLVWQLDDVSSEGWEFTTRLTTRAR